LIEGFSQLSGVFAASLGEGGPAAATAADYTGNFLNQFTGMQTAFDQVICQSGN
jgi:hypothetical protein